VIRAGSRSPCMAWPPGMPRLTGLPPGLLVCRSWMPNSQRRAPWRPLRLGITLEHLTDSRNAVGRGRAEAVQPEPASRALLVSQGPHRGWRPAARLRRLISHLEPGEGTLGGALLSAIVQSAAR
jgi:hypothetical protein